ncbi:unnamed protein product [Mytilus edulis]|uniref:Uncharacterized protein n=1 Tax=Mytilus edulis TaxID=6550 RepID=A0A8S3RW57_MYTED|nr:unnamed protein product [Mytilus edulis]
MSTSSNTTDLTVNHEDIEANDDLFADEIENQNNINNINLTQSITDSQFNDDDTKSIDGKCKTLGKNTMSYSEALNRSAGEKIHSQTKTANSDLDNHQSLHYENNSINSANISFWYNQENTRQNTLRKIYADQIQWTDRFLQNRFNKYKHESQTEIQFMKWFDTKI